MMKMRDIFKCERCGRKGDLPQGLRSTRGREIYELRATSYEVIWLIDKVDDKGGKTMMNVRYFKV